MMAENGKARPDNKILFVRIPKELWKSLKVIATDKELSLAKYIKRLIENAIKGEGL